MAKINQLIKDVHLLVRNETLKAEFKLLKEYGIPAKEAIQKLSQKKFTTQDGLPYCLSEKGIENIVYGNGNEK